MATSRSNLPKEMTPFGKGAKKANPFGGAKKAPPFGGKGKAPPFGKKGKPFAAGGVIPAHEGAGHMAASAANPPSKNALDDGKPSGGGTMKSMGAATRGGKFRGTF